MTTSQNKPVKSITELRKESGGHTRLLYHKGYWDGPQDGMMLWEGKRAWFSADGDDEHIKTPFTLWEKIRYWIDCKRWGLKFDKYELVDIEFVRYFNVYEIPQDLILKLEEQHNLFRFYVGTHTDYTSIGERDRGSSNEDLGGLMPYSLHDEFYNKRYEKIEMDLSKYPVIGRFKI